MYLVVVYITIFVTAGSILVWVISMALTDITGGAIMVTGACCSVTSLGFTVLVVPSLFVTITAGRNSLVVTWSVFMMVSAGIVSVFVIVFKTICILVSLAKVVVRVTIFVTVSAGSNSIILTKLVLMTGTPETVVSMLMVEASYTTGRVGTHGSLGSGTVAVIGSTVIVSVSVNVVVIGAMDMCSVTVGMMQVSVTGGSCTVVVMGILVNWKSIICSPTHSSGVSYKPPS